MSALAPSSLITPRPRRSPVMGSSCGSMVTSLVTSFSVMAKVSLISLWRWYMKPPLGQDKACSTENFVPHAQILGRCLSCQRYLIAIESKNSLFVRSKCSLLRGLAVSQFDAPLSCAKSLAFLSSIVRSSEAASDEKFVNDCFYLLEGIFNFLEQIPQFPGDQFSTQNRSSFTRTDRIFPAKKR